MMKPGLGWHVGWGIFGLFGLAICVIGSFYPGDTSREYWIFMSGLYFGGVLGTIDDIIVWHYSNKNQSRGV